MLHKVKLMRANIDQSDYSRFIYHEGRGPSDMIGIKTEPMVYTVAFDDCPLPIDEQRKGDIVPLSISTDFAGPLPDDTNNRCLEIRIRIQVNL